MRFHYFSWLRFSNRGGQGLRYNFEDIIKWVIAQLTFFQFYTPASIQQYGVGNPNGALWTISMEIQFYFFVMLTWKYLKKAKKYIWMILIIASMGVNSVFGIYYNALPSIVAKLINITLIPYLYVFFVWMFAYAYFEDIIGFLKNKIWLILCGYILWNYWIKSFVSYPLGHYADIVTGIGVCLITLGLAFKLGKRRVKYEISYGLYIYHMIVINVMIVLNFRTYTRLDAFIVLGISIIMALLSYRFVEKPCMNWYKGKAKNKVMEVK